MLLDNFYTILSSESSDSTIWTIQVKLNPGHPVYQGHFPECFIKLKAALTPTV